MYEKKVRTDERMNKWKNDCKKEGMNGWKKEWTNEWINENMSEWRNERTKEWLNAWTKDTEIWWWSVWMTSPGFVAQIVFQSRDGLSQASCLNSVRGHTEWKDGWRKEWMNGWKKKWMNKRMNKWKHEWM